MSLHRAQVLVMLLTVLVFGLPTEASADCGGSSTSSSSSSGSSYDDDDDDDDSCPIRWDYDDDDDRGSASTSQPSPRRPPCPISEVGSSVCRRFGDGWAANDVPALRLSLLASVWHLDLGSQTYRGSATHFSSNYRITQTGDTLGTSGVITGGGALRLDLTVFDYLSVGVEFGIASARLDSPGSSRGPSFQAHNVSSFAGGPVLGFALGWERVTFRLEVLLGGRVSVLKGLTRVGDCVDDLHMNLTEGLIEPRIGLDFWLSPQVSLFGMLGVDALSPGHVRGSVGLSLHLRSYDGRPAL